MPKYRWGQNSPNSQAAGISTTPQSFNDDPLNHLQTTQVLSPNLVCKFDPSVGEGAGTHPQRGLGREHPLIV